MRDQRVDAVEVMIVDVVTTVEVATDVVVVEDVDELVVSDARVSVDDVTSVVAVDWVEIIEDVEDVSVVPVEAVAVSADEVMGVEIVVVTGCVVRVELSLGLNLTALAVVIFEITPSTAKERISANTIRTGTDVI